MNGEARGTLARRSLGTTFRMKEVAPGAYVGLDLVLEEGPEGRDLSLASGADALGQDLKVAVLTPLGEDLLHRAFGFEGIRALTLNTGCRFTEELLRLSAMRVVAADRRIERVLEVEVERTDPALRAWRVAVRAQTVLDDVMELNLGEVARDA